MWCPDGYVGFRHLVEACKDAADCLHARPYISETDDEHAFPRWNATYHWLVLHFLFSMQTKTYICSPAGTILKIEAWRFRISRETNFLFFDFDPWTATQDEFIDFDRSTITDLVSHIDYNTGLIVSPADPDNYHAISDDIHFHFEQFMGWSVCFKEADVLMPPDEFLSKIESLVLGIRAIPERQSSDGRPERGLTLESRILPILSASYPNGKTSKVLWSTIHKHVVSELGEEVNQKTVERAMKRMLSERSRSAPS